MFPNVLSDNKLRIFILQHMKLFLLILTSLLILALSERITQTFIPQETRLDGGSTGLDSYRALILQKNRKFVLQHNSNPASTYKMEAYAMFAALTEDEVRAKYFITNFEAAFKEIKVEGRVATPSNPANVKGGIFIDLSNNYGTPVMNQGACGNCYAFSSVDTVNMNNKLFRRNYPLLSSQQLTDCSYNVSLLGSSNNGCNGGHPYISMEYIRLYGLNSITAYPQNLQTALNGTQQPCALINAPKYRINKWWYFNDYNCFSRIYYMQKGYAISVTVSAGNPSFWYYKSGVLLDCHGRLAIDHAVVMVGAYVDYGNMRVSYVILKNSWGVYWGESGKIRISLGANVCLACIYGTFTS